MFNDFVSYSFDSKKLQVIMIDYDPWFVLKDVCQFLEIQNIQDAFNGLDYDEKDTYTEEPDGVNYGEKIISESGLYSLIYRSDNQNVKRFKRWIIDEIMPEIREQSITNEVFKFNPIEYCTKIKDNSFKEFVKLHILLGVGRKYSVQSDTLYRNYFYFCTLKNLVPLLEEKFFYNFNSAFGKLIEQRKIKSDFRNKKCVMYTNISLLKDEVSDKELEETLFIPKNKR
ncbi:MAG: Bro-N domain-containing protein [Planctomycetaceae bacterium]|jgi:prophage antirepressor-like protein|nr:Bro-N domain-containing protein [Planctomycetaceae bacterium]